MTEKAQIIELLKNNGNMTQDMIAEAIYGDEGHTPDVQSPLMDLVSDGVVKRTDSSPAYYSLTDVCFMQIRWSNEKVNSTPPKSALWRF